jgi:hypothetical protein
MSVSLFESQNHISYDYRKSSLTFDSEYQKYTGDGIIAHGAGRVDDANR